MDTSVLADNTVTFEQLIEALEAKVDRLEDTIQEQSLTIEKQTVDNANLEARCLVNEGRITRLEKCFYNFFNRR